MSIARIIVGDARTALQQLEANSVHCIVTSPPYWGLRDYGVAGQIGLENSFEQYLAELLAVFLELRRVLRDDGTLWLNMGDSYATDAWGGGVGEKSTLGGSGGHDEALRARKAPRTPFGLAPKNLIGQPWRLAFALQEAGWWLRSDIIWHKPAPMPESVKDRPTKAHEYLFLFSKAERYFYDADALRESHTDQRANKAGGSALRGQKALKPTGPDFDGRWYSSGGRNSRTVWTIQPQPFSGAHFATFPPELPMRCISAGTSEYGCCASCGAPWERVVEASGGSIGHSWTNHEQDSERGRHSTGPGKAASRNGSYRREFAGWKPTCDCQSAGLGVQPCVVLDPFGGAGTTSMVAARLGRNSVMVELNPEYAALAEKRIRDEAGTLFNTVEPAAAEASA